MTRLFSEETHVRKHRILVDHKELQLLIANAVAEEHRLHVRLSEPGVSYKVTFEEATEGSPRYRVGTKATVEIFQDLTAEPVTAPGEPE